MLLLFGAGGGLVYLHLRCRTLKEKLAKHRRTTIVLRFLLKRQYLRLMRERRQKNAHQDFSKQSALLHAVINAMPDLVFFKDTEGKFQGCNQAMERFAQRRESELIGRSGEHIFDVQMNDYLSLHDARVARHMEVVSSEDWVIRPDGERVLLATLKAPVIDANGGLIGLLGICRDITEYKKTEEEIRKLAYYDSLTHLPNRRMLMSRLDHALDASEKSGDFAAVIFIDLDNFKTLNDTRGHDTGDQLLIKVSKRLQACVRNDDTVARLGGDEFLVMIEGLGVDRAVAAKRVEAIAAKIKNTLSRPYTFRRKNSDNGHEYHCTCSIGITLFKGKDLPVEELLKQADMAMYKSKGAGRNSFHFFQSDMQSAIEFRAELEADLHYALPRRELELFYQPQFNRAGELFGAEILLRWRHSKRGLISPAQFIPLAEENGLIIPMGQWIIETACQQLAEWSTFITNRHFQLAVNVSPRQFRAPDFVQQISQALERSGADPHRFKIELTEGVVLHDVDDTIQKMHKLRDMGIGFSMDDFGTGYSSLSYLKRLPLDQLKIDQSFIRDLTSNPDDEAIVTAIIGITRSLGLQVIAEGVETEAQRAFLEENGCHAFQGYLFGRPVPVSEFEVHFANLVS